MASSTERIGVSHCNEIAERNNWLFREQPINDIGIDAHMEHLEPSGESKRLLALQIKSGASWFKEKRDSFIIFRSVNERQYNYWTTNPLPCILVLYNPVDNTCIWQKLTAKTIERTKDGKGFIVKIPLSQVFLNDLSNNELLSYTNLPDHIINYNFLLSQKEFMRIIWDGGEVKLHSQEWINKSSGRGKTTLIVNDGKSIKEYSYPYWFPFTPYTMVFPRLFPWANFLADEDYYKEYDELAWRESQCCYDGIDDEWIVVGDSFEEYRKKLEPIRSIDYSGEVAEYMHKLSLNELGRAFLIVDSYVSQYQIYVNTRPSDFVNNSV